MRGSKDAVRPLDLGTARQHNDETLPKDVRKVAHFCSMRITLEGDFEMVEAWDD